MNFEEVKGKKAVCLFSGGLDSATVLWMALQDGCQPYLLTVSYHQRHAREVECARRIAGEWHLKHEIISLALPWKGSALLDPEIPVPVGRDPESFGSEIPATYVPGRNSIFLSLAVSFAEAIGAKIVLIGVYALDFSGYPDCRCDYVEAMEGALALGTKAGRDGKKIEIRAPLIRMTKREIILAGHRLGVPFEKTWSCYQGLEKPCGVCDSCVLRRRGFQEAGLNDPLVSDDAVACR
jgi:7-cyano-7-deazaguanine synthase